MSIRQIFKGVERIIRKSTFVLVFSNWHLAHWVHWAGSLDRFTRLLLIHTDIHTGIRPTHTHTNGQQQQHPKHTLANDSKLD